MIDGELSTGDRVRVRGREFVVRTNGTSTYLYTSDDALRRHDHSGTISTLVLRRDGVRVRVGGAPHPTLAPAPKPTALEPAPAPAPAPKPIALERESSRRRRRLPPRDGRAAARYVYVVRNCDLSRAVRELKIGVTSSVPATLRTYRRIVPNAQAIMVVDCGADAAASAARALETTLHRRFADFRVDRSEVFEVRAHEVRRALARLGYTHERDGIFRPRSRPSSLSSSSSSSETDDASESSDDDKRSK